MESKPSLLLYTSKALPSLHFNPGSSQFISHTNDQVQIPDYGSSDTPQFHPRRLKFFLIHSKPFPGPCRLDLIHACIKSILHSKPFVVFLISFKNYSSSSPYHWCIHSVAERLEL